MIRSPEMLARVKSPEIKMTYNIMTKNCANFERNNCDVDLVNRTKKEYFNQLDKNLAEALVSSSADLGNDLARMEWITDDTEVANEDNTGPERRPQVKVKAKACFSDSKASPFVEFPIDARPVFRLPLSLCLILLIVSSACAASHSKSTNLLASQSHTFKHKFPAGRPECSCEIKAIHTIDNGIIYQNGYTFLNSRINMSSDDTQTIPITGEWDHRGRVQATYHNGHLSVTFKELYPEDSGELEVQRGCGLKCGSHQHTFYINVYPEPQWIYKPASPIVVDQDPHAELKLCLKKTQAGSSHQRY